jgi:hypothetical protein
VIPTFDGVGVGLQVAAALDWARCGTDGDIREHCLWQLKELMTALAPEHLSTAAVVSLIAILVPEHSRFLAGRDPAAGDVGVVLRLVPGDGADAGAGA